MRRFSPVFAFWAALFVPLSAWCAGDAPSLAQLQKQVARLESEPRRNATTWLQHIQKEQASGHPRVVERRSTELAAQLSHALDGTHAGTHMAWGALVLSPDDILPVEDLHNVELVETGVLTGGSQPANDAWDLLKKRGFKSVVNLRKEDNSEVADVKAHGMVPLYIPVVDQKAPQMEQARQFVEFVNDPSHQPVYVHCHEGVGRTHTMIAAWRIATGAGLEPALTEGRTWGLSVSGQINFLKQFAAGAGAPN